ncbi:hypothetical protein FHG87_019042 [Trinorchestia longiramus]|nr:hypothetical protein FHG87_019042 [Trinorchestia longiramus]
MSSCRSSDGRLLVISSTDGYCSVTYFSEGELGEVYTNNSAPRTPLTPKQEVNTSLQEIVERKAAISNPKTNPSAEKEPDFDAELLKENISNVCEREDECSQKIASKNDANRGKILPEYKINVLIPKKSEKESVSSTADAACSGPEQSSDNTSKPSTSPPTVGEDVEEVEDEEEEEEAEEEVEEDIEASSEENDDEEEEAEELNSNDSESLGSNDSEMEDDDEGSMSLMSCDSDDDDKQVNSDDYDMGVTKIVHDDEVKTGSGSKYSAVNTFRNKMDKPQQKDVTQASTSTMARPNVCIRSVNLIQVKRKPDGNSGSFSSSLGSTPSPTAAAARNKSSSKPPRRVPLVTLSRPSSATPVKAASPCPHPPPVDSSFTTESLEMISDNTTDLCLKLEDEATVCSVAEDPADKTALAGTVDLHSALFSSGEESTNLKTDTNCNIEGDASPSSSKDTTLMTTSVASGLAGATSSTASALTPSKELSSKPEASSYEKKSSSASSKVGASENSTVGMPGGTSASAEVVGCTPKSAPRTPRRVSLITLSSPKAKKCLNANRNKPV